MGRFRKALWDGSGAHDADLLLQLARVIEQRASDGARERRVVLEPIAHEHGIDTKDFRALTRHDRRGSMLPALEDGGVAEALPRTHDAHDVLIAVGERVDDLHEPRMQDAEARRARALGPEDVAIRKLGDDRGVGDRPKGALVELTEEK